MMAKPHNQEYGITGIRIAGYTAGKEGLNMATTRIELNLDNQEYSWIVNSLQEHEHEVRSRLRELDSQGIDHSGLSKEADAVAELIAKIETAADEGDSSSLR